MSRQTRRNTAAHALPKLCGADIELGNFIVGLHLPGGTGFEASRELLAQIQGYPEGYGGYVSDLWSTAFASREKGKPHPGASSGFKLSSLNVQDVGRRFLASNGGSAYIDLNHLELCVPEVVSAYDHLANWHAMLRIARAALDRANLERDEDHRIQVLVNNSDGLGNASYGSHLNFLVSRRTFDDIFWRKAHYLQFLASFQISSLPLTGQGKAGSENGRAAAPYQLSQRADFFEVLHGIQTTFNRPIVNSRDEALSGPPGAADSGSPARLHVIFFDSALAHGSALLRVGPMQLLLTLIELDLVNARLILEDPLAAVRAYSRDPGLKARARLIGGEHMTAVELQSAYLEEVKRHAARGVFEGLVPRAGEIIDFWEDTLVKLARRDLAALAPRLDWVMKLLAMERAMQQQPGLDWQSAEIKLIDHMYSSLGSDGLYWAYEASGLAERLVSDEQIAHFAAEPPSDTRAWTRAMLLRSAARDGVEVDMVDWDRMTFKLRRQHGWPVYRTIELNNPLGFTKADTEQFFDDYASFTGLLDGLDALSDRRQRSTAVALAN
ncbi:MAG: proteasome accessory factor PafA2 family protein [Terracidiphilus sp.]